MNGVPAGSAPAPPSDAPLVRRLLSLAYEIVLLAALLLIGALPFVLLARNLDLDQGIARPLFQIYLLALAGTYFAWQWLHGGQTLPMKTWRLKIVTRDGAPLTCAHAVRRALFSVPSAAVFGAGYWWALLDRDRQFLHDRLAGTAIIVVPATTSSRSRSTGKSPLA